jgi:hypothetical protein
MKKIRVGFVGFWSHFVKEEFIGVCALRQNYEVEIMSDARDADYVFYSIMGDEHWFLPPETIKIFYTGENLCPDFNACDYAIGFEWLDYGDRYIRLANYYGTPYYRGQTAKFEQRYESSLSSEELHRLFSNRNFCSFVVSNMEGNSIRKQLFDALNRYKTVDSGGRWMNNVGGAVDDKIAFESRHKFSIACENSSHPGYTTEKIVEAFAARTIPIYWGDPEIGRVFNPKAFVNVMDYPSIDAVVQRVVELDNDEKAYQAMLQEPALLEPQEDSLKTQMEKMVVFMQHIVEQPLDKAQRYNRVFWGQRYLERERSLITASRKNWKDLLKDTVRRKLERFNK